MLVNHPFLDTHFFETNTEKGHLINIIEKIFQGETHCVSVVKYTCILHKFIESS